MWLWARLIGGALILVGAVTAIKKSVALERLPDARSVAAPKGICRAPTRDASVLIRMVRAIVPTIAYVSLIDAISIGALEIVIGARSLHPLIY